MINLVVTLYNGTSQELCLRFALFCGKVAVDFIHILKGYFTGVGAVILVNKSYQPIQILPSDTIWWHKSGWTLAQVMACCLTAPSHYLNQYRLVTNGQELKTHQTMCIFYEIYCSYTKYIFLLQLPVGTPSRSSQRASVVRITKQEGDGLLPGVSKEVNPLQCPRDTLNAV